jgi:hypothetical protein
LPETGTGKAQRSFQGSETAARKQIHERSAGVQTLTARTA